MESYPDYLHQELCYQFQTNDYIKPNILEYIFYNLYYIFKIFFILSGVIILSTSGSIIFISYYLYNPMINNFNEAYKKNKDLLEYDSFLFEYLDEYNEMENKNLSNSSLNLLNIKFIKYETKFGDIIMNYDYKNESFNYYFTKSHIIPFEYLDVVARIYVVKYDCKKIYISNDDNCDESWLNLSNKVISNEEDEEDVSNNNVFYKKNVKVNNDISEYFSNKYKYKGTIKDFEEKINKYNFKYYEYDKVKEFCDISNHNNFGFYLVHKKYDNFDYIYDDEPFVKNEKETISFSFFKNLLGSSINNKEEIANKVNNNIMIVDHDLTYYDREYNSKDILDKKNQ